jgi:acetylornithine/succinyldiaminopimelate/putrescine aminotransferase
LCDRHEALLVCDEVQCGLGRTGRLWAHAHDDVRPDIMTLAKPLAGGLPIGATLVTEAVAGRIRPGDHGTTFGAGPLVCRAAEAVFDRVASPGFVDAVAAKGERLRDRLAALGSPRITAVRGRGLLVGVALDVPAAPIIQAALARGMVVISAGERVLRLCPPLVIEADEIDRAVDILAECLAETGLPV